MKKKLSIIIPVFNSAELLDNCLSKLHPFNKNLFEIIIMDSESHDEIKNVIAKHSELPLIYSRELDEGIYDAFNKGVRLATGNLVFFMGADDIINPDIFNAIEQFPSEADILVGVITINGVTEHWKPGFLGWNLLLRNIPHQAMIFKRDIFEGNLYSLKYRILSDYAWNIVHFWDKNIKYSFVNKIFCEWSPGGISQRQRDYPFERDKFYLIKLKSPFLLFTFYSFYRSFLKKVFRC